MTSARTVAAAVAAINGKDAVYAPKAGDFWRINFSRVEWRVVISPDGKN